MGHPRWIMVRNTECTSFEDKIEKTKQHILDIVKKSNEAEKLTEEVQAKPLEMDSMTHLLEDNETNEQLRKKGGSSPNLPDSIEVTM